MNEELEWGAFEAPETRVRAMVDEILALNPPPTRILDVGCGTGAHLRALGDALPEAELVGVDVSEQNLERARLRCADFGGRARFVATDYCDFHDDPFDLVLADSVLQNVDSSDAALYAKLATDLATGGRLVLSIPDDSHFNHALWLVRRLARRLRGPRLERVALGVAARLHPDWDAERLRERLPYLYLLPFRHDGPRFRAALHEHGFALLLASPLPHASIAQPRHRFLVFERR